MLHSIQVRLSVAIRTRLVHNSSFCVYANLFYAVSSVHNERRLYSPCSATAAFRRLKPPCSGWGALPSPMCSVREYKYRIGVEGPAVALPRSSTI